MRAAQSAVVQLANKDGMPAKPGMYWRFDSMRRRLALTGPVRKD